MTSSSTRSSARAESGKSESRPGVSPRESISEKKATALNAVAFFVDFPPLGPPSWHLPLPALKQPCCRRNHSSLPQRKLELDAERCCGRDRCHSGGFLLRIMPSSWPPVPACTPRLRCRRCILLCGNDSAASIPKSGPEIKNRCSYNNRRRNYSSLPSRRLESDAENRCRYGHCRRNHSP